MELQDGTYFVTKGRLEPSSREKGYWVAMTDQTLAHTAATPDKIVETAQYLQDAYDVAYVGVWTHNDGRRVLDATHYVPELLQAIAMGRFWDQEAIWDIEHGHAIHIR
jgi:hypothetical protein